ncbi:MAG: DUF6391 domain-containing protein [Chloroflexota bacterium]
MLRDILSRTRRNHALEHATIHVLSEHHRGFSAQGNSTPQGFFLNIYGNLGDEAIIAAVEEAYTRLKKGEHHLAIHPNCGTVLLTTATMATLAAQMAFGLEQRRQKRGGTDASVFINGLPGAILAALVSLIVSRPVGMALQAKVTTDAELGNLQVRSVRRIPPSAVTRLFQFLLGQGNAVKVNAYQVETME